MAQEDEIDALIEQANRFKCEELTLDLDHDTGAAQLVSKSVLVGKILAGKKYGPEVVKNTMSREWHVDDGLEVQSLNKNMFLFSFKREKDRRRVLNGVPWSMAGNHMVLKEWPPHLALEEIDFSMSLLWLQVHGLPLAQMTRQNARKIGDLFAGPEEVDFALDNSLQRNSFMRLLVNVWVDKPLISGFFNRKENGEKSWVSFKYEWPPEFCYECGIMGHVATFCPQPPIRMAGEAEETMNMKFGPEMRTDSPSTSKPKPPKAWKLNDKAAETSGSRTPTARGSLSSSNRAAAEAQVCSPLGPRRINGPSNGLATSCHPSPLSQ